MSRSPTSSRSGGDGWSRASKSAILLLGGDKTGAWNSWYEHAIPTADDLYDAYLQELREEGLI